MTKYLKMKLKRGDVVLCQVPMTSTKFSHAKIRPAIMVMHKSMILKKVGKLLGRTMQQIEVGLKDALGIKL